MLVNNPIETLPGTSPITIKKLKLNDINTFFDLLNYFPNRYENFSIISPINTLQEGETVTIKGKIIESKNTYTRNRLTIQKIMVDDGTGTVEVSWFNQPYLARLLKQGLFIAVSGETKKFLHTFSIQPKEYEILKYEGQPTIHTGRIVPIYSEKKGISSKTLRDKVYRVVNTMLHNQNSESIETLEWLPQDIVHFNSIMPEYEALQYVHFPQTMEQVERARYRLSFDELFTVQLSTAYIKKQWEKEIVTNAFEVENNQTKIIEFISKLPFPLTGAQTRVTNEIIEDLKKTNPMNRFVQGDVGSGKTVVAAICAYISFLNGFQSLIMAPTEILAQQHFTTISKLVEPYGIKVGLQTGAKKMIKKGMDEFDIVIGTHALITEKLEFKKVGLVVIDEQHRFGVAQRAMLKSKGVNPHLLTMTATPIPRTVALTLYGELDLSVIDEMPKGRTPIKSFVVPKVKRNDAYVWVEKEIKTHRTQAFVICPLVEESETETMSTVKAATKEYEFLKNTVFKNLKVGLLHGRMKGKEKDEMMKQFKDKVYDVLVSTSVVEVGIDVPNATIMMIEGAERFGLAQLHQLRGRVGRGDKQSYCLLFTSGEEENTNTRLTFFANTLSGIKLAEFDFKIRGPGQIFGTQQSGYTDLKIANLGDVGLIDKTKKAATYFLSHFELDTYPEVKRRVNAFRTNEVTRD